MRMLPLEKHWTVDEVLALPVDGNRYEVVDGELLVTPAPTARHQHLLGELHARLRAYLEAEPVGTVFLAPADWFIDADAYVQPDLVVVPGTFATLPDDWRAMPRPLLVVEVLSPSTVRADRQVKRPRYQRAGVDEYWIVDPERRTIERWRPHGDVAQTIDDLLEWSPAGVRVPLRLDLREYFARADKQ